MAMSMNAEVARVVSSEKGSASRSDRSDGGRAGRRLAIGVNTAKARAAAIAQVTTETLG